MGGLIAHPIDAAPELLHFYRDTMAGASDDLTVFAGLVHAPDGSGAKLAALVVFHTGDTDEAERELEPFTTWGSPLMAEVGPMPPGARTPTDSEGRPMKKLIQRGSFCQVSPERQEHISAATPP